MPHVRRHARHINAGMLKVGFIGEMSRMKITRKPLGEQYDYMSMTDRQAQSNARKLEAAIERYPSRGDWTGAITVGFDGNGDIQTSYNTDSPEEDDAFNADVWETMTLDSARNLAKKLSTPAKVN